MVCRWSLMVAASVGPVAALRGLLVDSFVYFHHLQVRWMPASGNRPHCRLPVRYAAFIFCFYIIISPYNKQIILIIPNAADRISITLAMKGSNNITVIVVQVLAPGIRCAILRRTPQEAELANVIEDPILSITEACWNGCESTFVGCTGIRVIP